MLELPESHTIAKQLHDQVLHQTIGHVVANQSPHGFAFYHGDPDTYPSLLEGLAIDSVKAYGGLVELQLKDIRLLFGDGINLRYLEPGTKPPLKHQLYLRLADGGALVATIQMYGGIWAFPKGANDNFYYLVAKEKPSPLEASFDDSYFNQIWQEAKGNTSAKALLATQQRIPGLGNGTLQDILFHAHIHPKSQLSAIDQQDQEALFKSIKKTLRRMTDLGGRDTEKDLFGHTGGYQTLLSAKTWKNPCPICGGIIVRQAYLGGNVYYCPNCQPLKK